MNLQEGQPIGQYTITRRVGSGGMAVVYEANHTKLDRHVAIKMMHAGFQDDPDLLARFDREARIVAKLDHPNIVPIYDFDEHDGTPYLVMKFVQGRTLKWHMRKRALSLEEISTLCGSIAKALSYAHDMGVLHRDIKPGNVMIAEDGTPYLTDFGLARVAAQGESTLSAGMIVGTPHYLSPEQASGMMDVTAAADVYALGVMLYEMVVGQVPFAADSAHAIIHDHIYTPPPLPSKLNPEIPTEVELVLLKALEKDPAERYQNATALMADFERAVQESGLSSLSDDRSDVAARSIAAIRKERPNPTPTPARSAAIPAPKPKTATVEAEIDFAEVVGDVKRVVKDVVKQARDAMNSTGQTLNAITDEPYMPPSDDEIDTQIRKRVKKRMKARRGWWGHLMAYVMVNGSLLFSNAMIGNVGQEGFLQQFATTYNLESTAQALDVINGVVANAAIPAEAIAEGQVALVAMNQPWFLAIALFWGAGLMAHRVGVGALSARTQHKKEMRLIKRLELEYGTHWENTVTQKQYQQVVKRNDKRFDQLCGWWSHFWAYLFVNSGLMMAWLMMSDVIESAVPLVSIQDPTAVAPMQAFAEQPFFIIISMLWGIGLFTHMVSTIGGRSNGMERELARERRLSERRRTPRPRKRKREDKLKNEDIPPDGGSLDALLDDSAPAVRMTGDGELTNSTVEAWEQRHR